MATHDLVKMFDSSKIRVVWDDEQEKYFFSVVDVVGVLTEQQTARSASTYWAVTKKRLISEGADELITNCKQLKFYKKWHTNLRMSFFFCNFASKIAKHGNENAED